MTSQGSTARAMNIGHRIDGPAKKHVGHAKANGDKQICTNVLVKGRSYIMSDICNSPSASNAANSRRAIATAILTARIKMSSIFIFKGISYSTSTDCGFEAAFYVISPSVVVAKKSANPRRIRQHARRVRYPARIRVGQRRLLG